MDSLDEVAQRVKACQDCPLSQGRTHAVPGEGPRDARVMFVGEGPGFHEDRQGRPFVGPAGQFLEELLASVGLKREQVFITNVVKCRPPSNRDPLPGEIAACSKYLDRQTQLLKPDLLVTLGRYSLSRFFPRESISRVHGKVRITEQGLRVLPLFHPAAALHQQSLRAQIQEDFKAVRTALEQPKVDAGQESASEATPPPRQLGLF